MSIVHLETVRLVRRTLIRPANSCGNCGSHNGVLWTGVLVTHLQGQNNHKIRQAWSVVNPKLVPVSVNAPIIKELA